jgi:hypothetical protein
MKHNSFLQPINSISNFNTQTFLHNIVHCALLSPDPLAVQNRFMVNRLTHCKDLQNSFIPQHEFIIIKLDDTLAEQLDSHPIFMVLERIQLTVPGQQHSPHRASTDPERGCS